MKSKAIVCAIAAASLGFASLSFAQGYDGRGSRGDAPRGEVLRASPASGNRYVQNPVYPPSYGHDQRGFDRRQARDERRFDAQRTQFYRGGRIPNEYRSHQYVVNDWRGRHLHAPQQGQQWVQADGNYALIAIATGVIAQLVLNN
ncbi:RcnB family protein [Polaromonas sp.]|uniref:RcnB family protein n=1 Tax=Polaromonas sp. TaxID=1869339 RepID=UPI003265B085